MDHSPATSRRYAEGLTLRDAGGVLAGGSLRLSGRSGVSMILSRGWFDVRLASADLSRLPLEGELKDFYPRAARPEPARRLRPGVGAAPGAASPTPRQGVRRRGQRLGACRWSSPSPHRPSRRRCPFASPRPNSAACMQLRRRPALLRRWRPRAAGTPRRGMRSLAGLVGDVTSFARGRVTGRVDFASPDLRSLADLTANVQAKLNDAQALQMPVLKMLVPHLLPGRGVDFQAGERAAGRLAAYSCISELTLDSSLLLLLLSRAASRSRAGSTST